MTKILTIKLSKEDIHSIKHVLSDIAEKIEEGYHSGIECPVNWGIRKVKDVNNNFESLQNQVRDLRDNDGTHICPCHENPDEGECTCYKYDNVIDTLENMKHND